MPSTDDEKKRKKEIEIQFHHNRAKAVLQMRLHLHKESLREQTHTLCVPGWIPSLTKPLRAPPRSRFSHILPRAAPSLLSSPGPHQDFSSSCSTGCAVWFCREGIKPLLMGTAGIAASGDTRAKSNFKFSN